MWRAILEKQLKCVILHNVFGFEGIVSLAYLVVSNRTGPHLRQPDRICGNSGVITVGTNAQYQNLLASKCYLICKH